MMKYDEELENLINIALSDGSLTEKKRQILYRKAQTLGIDLDEFEIVLNARIYNLTKGDATESMQLNQDNFCSDLNTKTNKDVQYLLEDLDEKIELMNTEKNRINIGKEIIERDKINEEYDDSEDYKEYLKEAIENELNNRQAELVAKCKNPSSLDELMLFCGHAYAKSKASDGALSKTWLKKARECFRIVQAQPDKNDNINRWIKENAHILGLKTIIMDKVRSMILKK